jgi:hypothetical protein
LNNFPKGIKLVSDKAHVFPHSATDKSQGGLWRKGKDAKKYTGLELTAYKADRYIKKKIKTPSSIACSWPLGTQLQRY